MRAAQNLTANAVVAYLRWLEGHNQMTLFIFFDVLPVFFSFLTCLVCRRCSSQFVRYFKGCDNYRKQPKTT